MSQSSPEGIELGKGSRLVSSELSINKEKVLSIKQKETLEEFIQTQLSLGKYQEQGSAIRHSIELGAKWQAERICDHTYILTSEQGHRVIKCQKCSNIQPI